MVKRDAEKGMLSEVSDVLLGLKQNQPSFFSVMHQNLKKISNIWQRTLTVTESQWNFLPKKFIFFSMVNK